ncbi:hypothetical protein [Cellulomonas carbonis]|uniref:Right handed beta helix domain-containing protein n=1 Tax=Cellulomonas carbonis T26 TaxID=947969 RepID=A0A0A0BT43_9CELL|nr:hypothetical protein [Cellulomonas carbonis]KGM10304.1 hypothetical protein N868_15750 [Cellulomonas carbonis T26]GGC05484.1 hypothetical protein GCM10010972_18320 [Cellulomonas carbonis]
MHRTRSRVTTVLAALAVAVLPVLAAPAASATTVPDQIRYGADSIHRKSVPATVVPVEMWSSTPAARTEIVAAGRVVASDTTVEARDGYWAGVSTADFSGLSGWTTVTLRITTPEGVVRSSQKIIIAEPSATVPDQIRWDGRSVHNSTVPAQPVELEMWSSTAAARTEVLIGGRVVASDTTVEAREGYWAGVATADLTGLSGWTTATLRITTPTGEVRTENKNFIAETVATVVAPQPDQIRWNGASLYKKTVATSAATPLEVWSSTPASKVELLLGGVVVATDTTVEARADHWLATADVDLSALPKGPASLTMRVTPSSGFARSSAKVFTADPVLAPLTPEVLAARPGAHNTGVPAGTTLRPSGSLTITQDGTVVDGLDITGCVVVDADDVTIRNTRITCTDAPRERAVRMEGKHTGLLLEDVEIDGRGLTEIGVDVNSTVLRRVDVHGFNDGIRMGHDLLIEDSWVHDMTRQGDLHPDAIQGISAEDVVIRNNTLDPTNTATGDRGNAAIQLGSETGTLISRNVVIEGNLLDGGNVSLNVSGAINAENIAIRSNRFGTGSKYGPVLTPHRVTPAADNVMDVLGTAIVVRWTD